VSRFTAFEAAGTWCCWENLEDAAKRARELREKENAEALAALHTDWAVEDYCFNLRTARLTVRMAVEVMA
jgi:hypothetical protein